MRGAERQRLAGPELEEGGARAAAERGRERSDARGALASAPAFNEGRQAWFARSAAHACAHRGVLGICKASALEGEDVRHLNPHADRPWASRGGLRRARGPDVKASFACVTRDPPPGAPLHRRRQVEPVGRQSNPHLVETSAESNSDSAQENIQWLSSVRS